MGAWISDMLKGDAKPILEADNNTIECCVIVRLPNSSSDDLPIVV